MVRSDYSTSSTENSDVADPLSDSYADESDLPPYSHNNKGNGGGGNGSSHPGSGGKNVNFNSSSRNNKKSQGLSISGLNRRLRTEYIDVDPTDDSFGASLIRGIVGLVGSCFTPRQILVALRLLKAVTVAFIALTAAANVVYISCNEFVANNNNNNYFGHRRDTILRLYGLVFAVLALLIELDKFVMKNLKVLKGFLARFGILFFVATVTYCHPAQMNDNNGGAASGVPPSAVVFQMVASMVL